MHTLHMPALQDAEDSSEDEYDTVSEPSRIENGLLSDTHTKPHESYDEVPLLPRPASTLSPDSDPQLPTQASSATIGRSPTPDFQPSAQTSRKRKQQSSLDSNAAQNRELIDSNLHNTCQPGTSVHGYMYCISHVTLRHLLTHLSCVYNRPM
jgi:hypothetical protein